MTIGGTTSSNIALDSAARQHLAFYSLIGDKMATSLKGGLSGYGILLSDCDESKSLSASSSAADSNFRAKDKCQVCDMHGLVSSQNV